MRHKPHYTNSDDHKRARQLRKQSSLHEQKLWSFLRQAVAGTQIKFRRQQPIHPYIVDFVCMNAKLVVELDGMSHDMRQVYDEKRDNYLRQQDYTVLRIINDEVGKNPSDVVEAILARANELLILRTPSPAKAKDLLRKPRLLHPLPQGERKK